MNMVGDNRGGGQKAYIEFVSANPTGPLHVGHGRGAAYGSCVANLLEAIGFTVHREYYVNDVGRQMSILGLSVWIRYLQEWSQAIHLPKNAYQGQYICDIANQLSSEYQDKLLILNESVRNQFSAEAVNQSEGIELHLDCCIECMKQVLGEAQFKTVCTKALNYILNDIEEDLTAFGVHYDRWFKESELLDKGLIQKGINLLRSHDYVYEKEGAVWFKATQLGDDKDRVLVRRNGSTTYFASDVAYHLYKYDQNYNQLIDVFGADHHGYIPRIAAFLKGLKKDPQQLTVLLVQFVTLYRNNIKVSMSTRTGDFITLRELREEVGHDAARFFYIMRKPGQHLDFDIDLAKSKANENPVYYIQYAHARICSIWRQLKKTNYSSWDKSKGLEHLSLLSLSNEKELLMLLSQYPTVVQKSAELYEPHFLAHYLKKLAHVFHSYYNAERLLVDQDQLRNARLCLVAAVKQIIVNGLTLLGVSAPEKM